MKQEHVQRFVESLRSHAAREDALLYRWAAQLDHELQKALLGRLSSHGVTAEEHVQPRV